MLQTLRNFPPLLARNNVPALANLTRTYGMGSHVSNNDPEVLEKAKEKQMKGKTKSHFPDEAPGWEEALASDSEAVVKAERSKPKSIKEMQDQTVECLHDEMEEEPDKVNRSNRPNA